MYTRDVPIILSAIGKWPKSLVNRLIIGIGKIRWQLLILSMHTVKCNVLEQVLIVNEARDNNEHPSEAKEGSCLGLFHCLGRQ